MMAFFFENLKPGSAVLEHGQDRTAQMDNIRIVTWSEGHARTAAM